MRLAIFGGTGIHLRSERIETSYHRSDIPNQKRCLQIERAICSSDRHTPAISVGRSHFYCTNRRCRRQERSFYASYLLPFSGNRASSHQLEAIAVQIARSAYAIASAPIN